MMSFQRILSVTAIAVTSLLTAQEAPLPVARIANPQSTQGLVIPTLPTTPTAEQLCAYNALGEPLLHVSGEGTDEERKALAACLVATATREESHDLTAFVDFCNTYPNSPWRPSVELNCGLQCYKSGFFSKSLQAFKNAWDLTKDSSDTNAKRIADLAGAEYALLCAKIGRKSEVEVMITAFSTRNPVGSSRVRINQVREGLWMMNRNPEYSFRCGTYALATLHSLTGGSSDTEAFIEATASTEKGFSLWELKQQAEQELNMSVTIGKRPLGSKIVVPSVIHWGVDHYGAIVEERDGRYLLQDPTFGESLWISKDAIDAEGSGYFLIEGDQPPARWTVVDQVEAETIFGKGAANGSDEKGTSDCDKSDGGDGDGCGMAAYSFNTMLCSLKVWDIPVGYSPARGNDVFFKVTYNQKEAYQPTTINYSNVGPQWSIKWISYLEENPNNIGSNITVYTRGGGSEEHTDYNRTTKEYIRHRFGDVTLKRISDGRYERRFSDGSAHLYAHAIGTSSPRRVYLSEIVDPQGNAVTLQYDSTPTREGRLLTITDAIGQQTSLSYEEAGSPFLVTKVTDPFGRFAQFQYENAPNGGKRLKRTIDVIGIESSFDYNSSEEITALHTPYGTTTFASGSPMNSEGLWAWTEATDPHGDKERIENYFTDARTGIDRESVNGRPLGMGTSLSHIEDRNSFYWDKQQMRYHAGNYKKAHIYHWALTPQHLRLSRTVESEKPPLSNRIWYNYDGQSSPTRQGTRSIPSRMGRVIEKADGGTATELVRYTYNDLSNPTLIADPAGRITLIEYAANQIDVTHVRQKVGALSETLFRSVYDPDFPAHRPKDIFDASNQKTSFTYNLSGQVTSITNPRNETTTFVYETDHMLNGFGKVKEVRNNQNRVVATITYDSAQRVATFKDESNHITSFEYDDFDRQTKVIYPDGSEETYEYQDLNLKKLTNRDGLITTYQFDRLGRPTVSEDSLGRLTQIEWCRCGDIRKLIDAEGKTTHWERDAMGRVATKTLPDGRSFSFDYEALSGRVSSVTDPEGQEVSCTYNVDSTLKQKDYLNANIATASESYLYDEHYNRLTSMSDGVGTTTYTYYPSGTPTGALQIQSIDGVFPGASDTVRYTYDSLGRLASRNIGANGSENTVSYGFDDLQRLSTVTNNLGIFTNSYVGDSERLDYIDYPGTMRVDLDYTDINGDLLISQIKNLTNRNNASSVLSQFDYTYTQQRQIESWTQNQSGQTAEKWTLGYDRAYQLSSATINDLANPSSVLKRYAFAYDKAGNRISKQNDLLVGKAIHNSRNQLVSTEGGGHAEIRGFLDKPAKVTVNAVRADVDSSNNFTAVVPVTPGDNTITVDATDFDNNSSQSSYNLNITGITAQSFTYDFNGNMTSDGNRSFEWDAKNRLVTIIDGTKRSECVYDGQDRRVKIIEKDNGITTSEKWFVWCGTLICEERNGSNQVTRRYFGNGEQRISPDPNPGNYLCVKDHLGSTREMVNASNGVIRAQYQYSPYGVRAKTQGDLDCDFGFTGHYTHQSSDLVFTLYRIYDSKLARWLSPDPLGEGVNDQGNLYNYVGSDPINFWDPLGLIIGGTMCDDAIASALSGKHEEAAERAMAAADVQKQRYEDNPVAAPLIDSVMGALGLASRGRSGKLTNSQKKSIRSYERLIREHQIKLKEWLRTPDKYDHKGLLKNKSPEIRDKIIKGRARHLEREIEAFKNNIEKVKKCKK